MKWRVAKNEWNVKARPWREAGLVEEDDPQATVPALVCAVYRGDDVDEKTRLIAAAPELLEAAQYLSELYDHIWFDMSKVTDGERQAMERAWGHLDAAIAKAAAQ